MTDHVHEWEEHDPCDYDIAPYIRCAKCKERLELQDAIPMLNAAEQLLPLMQSMNNEHNYYATFAAFGDSVPEWIWELAKARGGE
jgi:hypothetical protein